ncbi:alpha/beta hydrolase [Sphingobium algorifonticola]|uniref:Alpha/beta hydrolase n=1 Tax=Sphingobium algorifonticola TaxID=2008318 RepID=A0A437J3S4_9SPHN|nr:alpha/beta hydrolase [Sphingobium algorifonticola]RVT39152.1 alpha/beta hydrolase [Sphingobium algorifonticola]
MYIDPDAKRFLDSLAAGPPPPADIQAQRAGFSALWRSMAPVPPTGVTMTCAMVPASDHAIECLIYRPSDTDAPLPVVIFYHGGGGIMLSPEDFDATNRMLAHEVGCMVVVPRYRQAPENPFPAPVDDCVAVYEWLIGHAKEWGGDPGLVIVSGDSAGGYLAAAVAQDAKRKSLPMPLAQVLLYPMLDMAGMAPSRFDRAAFTTHDALTSTVSLHFGDAVLDPRASPLREPDLDGLPPAMIIAVDTDPLFDEARAYATRLRTAGVPTSFFVYEGQVHGFFSFGGAMPEGNRCVTHVAGWVARAFRMAAGK